MIAAGEVERLPVAAAETQVGGGRRAVHHHTQLLARRVHHPQATGAAAVHVAFDVHLHPVRDARRVAGQVSENPVGLPRQRAVGVQVEGADVSPARVVDVQHALVGREGQPVGNHEVVYQQRDGAQVRGDAVYPGVLVVPLFGRCGQRPRVGEVDAAVGLHHHVVGAVEAAALEAGGHHGDAAVGLGAGHAAAVVLAGDEAALQVAGEAVGAVGGLVVDAGAFTRHVLNAPVVVDVAKQQVAAVGPPHRPLGRAVVAAVVVGRVPRDLGVGGNDARKFRGKLLDRHNPLLQWSWLGAL